MTFEKFFIITKKNKSKITQNEANTLKISWLGEKQNIH